MWLVHKICMSTESLPIPAVEHSLKIDHIMFGDKISLVKNRRKVSLCPNIVTPDTIPEFCIPPKIPSHYEQRSTGLNSHMQLVQMQHPQMSAQTRRVPACKMIKPHVIHVESVDELPCDNRYSDEENTNADPQSQAALSLLHLAKAQTCYGFCTLLESPHTRRKESLFHNDPSSHGIPLVLPRSRSNTFSGSTSSSSSSFTSSLNSLTTLSSRFSSTRLSLSRQATLEGDTTSSEESSPFTSPTLPRPFRKSSLFKALSTDRLFFKSAKRSSLSRNNSLSTDEGSSTDSSPSTMRRSECMSGPMAGNIGLLVPPVHPTNPVLFRDKSLKENLIPLGMHSTLRLSAEYSPENQQLRMRLIGIEGLYAPSVNPKSISCSVRISLLPGKVQKQQSTIIHKSRNPIFNEDFFFDAISEDELYYRSMHFKVLNKMPSMKRDNNLANCDVPLTRILMLK